MDIAPFRYMAWAKDHQAAGRYPLQMSGVPSLEAADLGVPPAALRLVRPITRKPDEGLAAAVASRYGVPPECVMPCCGTHHANYLLARVLAGPGTGVLVEEPNYEGVPGVFRLVGAEVRGFRRRREESWRLPVPEIREGLAAGARLVVLTDLHNPTGTAILPDESAALEAMARDFGAKVLVDEVYRDFLPPPAATSFRPGGPFVVSSSLTKVYGLGGLRIGWALADPDVVAVLRDLNDYVVVNMPSPAASLALAAWGRLDAIAARNRDLAGENLRVLAAWVRGRGDVRWSMPDGGISALLELDALRGRDDVAWVEDLIRETGVVVVPGSMFGAPGSIRLSYGLPGPDLREALARLAGFLEGSEGRGRSSLSN